MVKFILIGASILTLNILDNLGKISVNNLIVKIIIGAYLVLEVYRGKNTLMEVFDLVQ